MACASGGGGRADVAAVPEQFPVGLRVLVVDDDVTCLRILERMLRRCMYEVTSCSQATVALNLLRERKGCFDIVLSDVHMPDMDGFKLLELVGLEMDLPVIMMSADGRTHLVMRGIRHGACDYLIKPIRDEQLKNIWQHVIRKRWNEIKESDHNSSSMADPDCPILVTDDTEYASSTSQGPDEGLTVQKKKRDSKDEDDEELENDDLATTKRPRVVWSVELHQQFVSAVNQLGIDKAVPKRILELMNVPGLTRENVASHLQKFRLYLKRLSGVAQHQAGLPNFCGPVDQNLKLAPLGRFDIQTLATSGQIPPQTLAALHAELLSQAPRNLVLPAMDQRTLLQASLQGSKCIPVDGNVAYGQPLVKCSSNIAKQTSQPTTSNEDILSEFMAWSPKNPGEMLPALVGETNNNMLISFIQHQQQQKHPIEPSRSINVQPSCLVVPSLSSLNFHTVNSPGSVNQSCGFRNSALDYNKKSLQTKNSPASSALEIERKPCTAGSVSSTSRSVRDNTCQRVPSSQTATGTSMHGSSRSPMCLKGTSIPSRFAVSEYELPMSNISQVKLYSENNGNKVKQEMNMDVRETINMGIPVRQQHLTPNDPMRVFSD